MLAIRRTSRWTALAGVVLVAPGPVAASGVGRRLPPEKRIVTDPVTGLSLTFLTTDPANDSKPYQTHPTWTADGRWILMRSSRGDGGQQAYLIDERAGDIVQVTEGATDLGSLTLSRKTNTLYLLRGGPGRAESGPSTSATSPRQIVAVNLDPLVADALGGVPQPASAYERVIATLPSELRGGGGLTLDADESRLYLGVNLGPPLQRRRDLDDRNMDPTEDPEAARARFEEAGRGRGGIRSVDVRTGEIRTVVDVPFRLGHLQANPWVPGELVYCHETTGDAPQRIWTVRADGTGNRPLYVESPDEWVTHETFAAADQVMFNILGHLPRLRHRPTGIAVVNLRSNHVTLLGQIDEDGGGGRTGGLWHCNGSPDGRWAVGDSFKGDVYLIDRRSGERILLTTGHPMRPDHAHPIFSPDGNRILIQSGRLTDGRSLDLVVVEIPAAVLDSALDRTRPPAVPSPR
jgi:oligogalacturonide lyase